MALMEQLDAADLNADEIAKLTPYDFHLPHIEMDPEQAKYHPDLCRVDRDELASAIDAIYVAAGAGNEYARFLILASAAIAENRADADIKAFGKDTLQATEDDLAEYEREFAYETRRTAPKAPLEEILDLDMSLAIIELAYEDAARES